MNPVFRTAFIRFVFLLGCALSAKAGGMVLKLDPQIHFIQVTPEYSNAVVSALLPYYSDFAKKLDLPIPLPIKPDDIAHWAIQPDVREGDHLSGGGIILKSGWSLGFEFGYVNGFASPRSFYGSENLNSNTIPKFYGQVEMTTNEIVQLARNSIKKLGVSLEDVFADQEPQIKPPQHFGTNIVPSYLIKWPDPRGGYVRMEVNAETKRVEELYMLTPNLMRSPPKINIIPPKGRGMFDSMLPPPSNPAYAWKLIPIALKAVEDYGQKLSLPVPHPLTTNDVAEFDFFNNGGWPHCEITLTNGWRFIYRHCMVNGYYSPHILFTADTTPFHAKDFEGHRNLTTNQAIELVKKTLAKLNYPTNNIHMDFAPTILYAAGNFKKIIPRYFFEWDYENATHDDLQSKVEAEVNADNGKVESLYYDDTAYWNCRPPIDVPISMPSPK